MLKILCYIADKDAFEYIASSESGRLATRIQNPFSQIPEIQDLERLLQAKFDEPEHKPEGLADLIASVHEYNETVSTYERVRYIKTITSQVQNAMNAARAQCDSRHAARNHQNQNTILDMKLTVIKVERDGE